jgi:molybdopterin-guanine dinucleotide biosynthesis protein A
MIETAVLLAGGQSRRMGRDKSLLPFGDVPLAVKVYETLGMVFPSVVVVSRQSEFPVAGATCLADRHPGNGPLEGLASALEAGEAPRVLLAACDMPFLHPDLLRHLAQQADDADAIVPCSPRGPEPLLGIYARRALPTLRSFLAEGNRSAMRFLERIPTRLLAFEEVRRFDPDGASFRNLNHLEDYQEALRDWAHSQERM